MSNDPGGRPSFAVSAPHLTMLVVCVVAVYFVVGFYGKSLDSYRINQRAAEVRQEIVLLEAQNRKLQENIAYLQSDSFVETAAREKLNLARPGDRSVVVIQELREAAGPPSPPRDGARGASFPPLAQFGHLEEWLDLFFDSR